MSQEHPVEIFDVTIRDGSYAVDFQFNADDIRFLYPILEQIGFGYIEIGHGLGLDASAVNRAAASDEEYLAAAAAVRTTSKFGTFFIPGIGAKDSLRRAREEYGMDFIRIGKDATQIEKVVDYVSYAKELGFEVMCNFMKSYIISPQELARKSQILADHGASVVYVVDSAGGMLPNEVGDYFKALQDTVDVRTGFHAHNNLELAVANCLVAREHGCTLLDCSIGGLGRSAGNARTELLIPALAAAGAQTGYDFLEVLRVWEQLIAPILSRRTLGPAQVAGGYALVHSALIGPFKEQARDKKLRLEALLNAYAESTRVRGEADVDLEALAAELASDERALVLAPDSSNDLLSMSLRDREPNRIRNSYRSVQEVFAAAHSLSCKSYLPLALVVTLESAPVEEDYVAAEFVCQDERFILLQVLASSAEAFLEACSAELVKVDLVALNDPSAAARDFLSNSEAWQAVEQVVSLDLLEVRARHFFSVIDQALLATSGQDVLIYGGSTGRLGDYLRPSLGRVRFFKTVARPYNQLGVEALGFGGASSSESAPDNFPVVALLSQPEPMELDRLLARVQAEGMILDFARTGADGQALATPVDLNEAISGELVKLTGLELARREPVTEVTS